MRIFTFEKTRNLVQRGGRFAFPLRTVLPRAIFLGWLLAVVLTWILAGFLASGLLVKQHPANAVETLSQWDGNHYARIAAEGYQMEGISRREFNFFPAFPAIARLFGGREHPRLAGIIFNQLLFLVSLAL